MKLVIFFFDEFFRSGWMGENSAYLSKYDLHLKHDCLKSSSLNSVKMYRHLFGSFNKWPEFIILKSFNAETIHCEMIN